MTAVEGEDFYFNDQQSSAGVDYTHLKAIPPL